jgi:hypothetical protein
LDEGVLPGEIERRLSEERLDAQTAAWVVRGLEEARRQATRTAGRRNMLYGALWCSGGALIMILAYQSSESSSPAGRYVVAWGAIVVGAFLFLRGLRQFTRR